MAASITAIMMLSIWLLFEASCDMQLQRLVEIARARASLIDAVARLDEHNDSSSGEVVANSVLRQVREAHNQFSNIGESGEFSLAKLNGDFIEFLLDHRHGKVGNPQPVPMASDLAEPMRRALLGRSGTLIGKDYRGEQVLAAYEPVTALGWGVVAKINVGEIRAPFIKAALISALMATLIIALGSLLIIRIVAPLLKRLADDAQYQRTLFQSSPIGLALCTMDGRLVETNTAYDTITGRTLDEANALSYWDITPESYRDDEAEQLTQLEQSGKYGPYEKEYIHKDGSLVPVRLSGMIVHYGGEKFIWSSAEDISDRVSAERRLRQAAAIFESTDEGIVITDSENRITMVNSAFCKITGYSEEEAIGQNPRILHSGKHDQHFYQNLWHQLEVSGNWRGEMWNRRKDGTVFPVWQQISVIEDKEGKVINYASIFSDISSLKAVEQQLSHLAHHDELTGLPNRLYFKAQIENSIHSAKRNQHMVALLFLDLDGFKQINDSCGHDAGDQLLKVVAQRLKQCVRDEDTVARMGGDEFVIILNRIKQIEDAELVAGNILKAVGEPVILPDCTLFPSTSIGISIYPNDAISAIGLQKAADHAMYMAKDSGKNGYQIFSQQP
jgi:diguanylate cyclase (GGDEF)-like protein/PAS domain S-box-containing protein